MFYHISVGPPTQLPNKREKERWQFCKLNAYLYIITGQCFLNQLNIVSFDADVMEEIYDDDQSKYLARL